MVLASFACTPGFLPTVAIARLSAARRQNCREPVSRGSRARVRAALRVVLAGGPQLLARLGLLDADRLRLRDEQLERLPVATSSRRRSSRPFLRSRSSSSWRGRAGRARRSARAPASISLVGRLDLLGVDDRRQHRLAAQRVGGLGLGLVRERLLVLAGDLQVGLLRDPLARQRRRASARAARVRARERACSGSSISASATAASSTASRNSRSIARSSASRSRRRCPRAAPRACRTPAASEANSSSSSGRRLALTSLTVTSKRRPGRRARPDSPRGT